LLGIGEFRSGLVDRFGYRHALGRDTPATFSAGRAAGDAARHARLPADADELDPFRMVPVRGLAVDAADLEIIVGSLSAAGNGSKQHERTNADAKDATGKDHDSLLR
jgi:hypothetical protein